MAVGNTLTGCLNPSPLGKKRCADKDESHARADGASPLAADRIAAEWAAARGCRCMPWNVAEGRDLGQERCFQAGPTVEERYFGTQFRDGAIAVG